ncbi:MAG: exodeoxyribonuclease VII small subunit [Ruminococcaceae bacterium]|nr:exodeoxyribonuclease VII small subunit [Oscillospiraceae bacterium]
METKMSFEEALARLEKIAAELEQGNLPLEQSLKYYEEGAALAQLCSEALKNARQRVTELSAEISAADRKTEE